MDRGVPLLYVDEDMESKLPWLYVLLNKCSVNVVTFNASNKNHIELNPSKVLPFLVVDDTSVWGTLAAFMFLAEKYGSNVLYGQAVEERAKMNSILYWCGSTLIRSVLINFVYPQTKVNYSLPGEENKEMLELGLRNTRQQLDTLEKYYFNEFNFMCGEKETIVDYYTALILMELDGVNFDLSNWPKTRYWLDEMKSKVKNIFP